MNYNLRSPHVPTGTHKAACLTHSDILRLKDCMPDMSQALMWAARVTVLPCTYYLHTFAVTSSSLACTNLYICSSMYLACALFRHRLLSPLGQNQNNTPPSVIFNQYLQTCQSAGNDCQLKKQCTLQRHACKQHLLFALQRQPMWRRL